LRDRVECPLLVVVGSDGARRIVTAPVNPFRVSWKHRAMRALVFGLVLTIMVQSSSITTSLVVPLAGAGLLTLRQIFPFTLGANLGTTITAMLAALVTGAEAAVTVAFAHVLFNLVGVALAWPLRRIPMGLATSLADWSIRSRLIPIAYIVTAFFLTPMALIYLLG
jgi:sodium-dependent phosphate cotransporter